MIAKLKKTFKLKYLHKLIMENDDYFPDECLNKSKEELFLRSGFGYLKPKLL